MSKAGFTLVEIMVTLFILMVVGILISTGLNSVLKTDEIINKKRRDITDIQLAIIQIEHDMQQVINQPIRISNNNLEFTRSGLIDPSNIKTRLLQRVTYRLDGTNLFRI